MSVKKSYDGERQAASFRLYLFSRGTRFERAATALLCLLVFALLRYLYPFPNTYGDTGAYIRAAGTGAFGIFRPIGYSGFLAGTHALSKGPALLVFLQTLFYFGPSLLLFLSAKFFFQPQRDTLWRVFLFPFLLAPACLYLCQFVISDILFISLTNAWLACGLVVLRNGSGRAVALHTLLLVMLLLTRYISLFYPLVTVILLYFSFFAHSKRRFFGYVLLQAALFLGVIQFTRIMTERSVGLKIFSGFGGWQQASNAMHILPYQKGDIKPVSDPELRHLDSFIRANFSPARHHQDKSVTVSYLWDRQGPLMKYMHTLRAKSDRPYLYHWHLASGPLGRWGSHTIRAYPGLFLEHYLKPNFLSLFALHPEVLFEFRDPPRQIKDWFGCKGCNVWPRSGRPNRFLERWADEGFNVLWILFGLSLPLLLFRKRIKMNPAQHRLLLILSFFCLVYTALSVYASPVVLRYMLAIRHALILVPFLMFQQYFPGSKKDPA